MPQIMWHCHLIRSTHTAARSVACRECPCRYSFTFRGQLKRQNVETLRVLGVVLQL